MQISLLKGIVQWLFKGMRPYVKRSNAAWQQQGEEVELLEEKLRYHKQNLAILIQENQQDVYADYFRKLSFKIDLKPMETVEIAYCIPYTYTQLLEDIKLWKYLYLYEEARLK